VVNVANIFQSHIRKPLWYKQVVIEDGIVEILMWDKMDLPTIIDGLFPIIHIVLGDIKHILM